MITGTKINGYFSKNGNATSVYRVTATTQEELDSYKASQAQLVYEKEGDENSAPLFFSVRPILDNVIEIGINPKTNKASLRDETGLAETQLVQELQRQDALNGTNTAGPVVAQIAANKLTQIWANKRTVTAAVMGKLTKAPEQVKEAAGETGDN